MAVRTRATVAPVRPAHKVIPLHSVIADTRWKFEHDWKLGARGCIGLMWWPVEAQRVMALAEDLWREVCTLRAKLEPEQEEEL